MPGSAHPPQAVLFACSYNAVRSAMAEGLMRLRFGRSIWVDSCGARPAAVVDPFAVAVMDELGVDLSRHRPKTFDDLEDFAFDLVVSLSPEAHHRALELTRTLAVEAEYWPTFDPTADDGPREMRLDAYRSVRDALDRRIAQRFARTSTPPG
jgi:protein-tyrosine-phosphatase